MCLTYPVLLRSIMLGNKDRKYAQVQIRSKITDSKLWKLNSALCNKQILLTKSNALK